MLPTAPTRQARPTTSALCGVLLCAHRRRPTQDSTKTHSTLSSRAQMVGNPHIILITHSKSDKQPTTKLLHHRPSPATLVLRNLAEPSMLPPKMAVTWAISTSPSAKAKATTLKRAPMLAMLRHFTIASTQQLTVATCLAYVCSISNSTLRSCTDLSQKFFNSYVLSENAIPQGLYCSMYNQTYGPSYGTNYGQYRGSDRYTVSESYSYSKSS